MLTLVRLIAREDGIAAVTLGVVTWRQLTYGRGSKSNRRVYTSFGPCFHFRVFHFSTGFLCHGHIAPSSRHLADTTGSLRMLQA